jgi:hypothetical protein
VLAIAHSNVDRFGTKITEGAENSSAACALLSVFTWTLEVERWELGVESDFLLCLSTQRRPGGADEAIEMDAPGIQSNSKNATQEIRDIVIKLERTIETIRRPHRHVPAPIAPWTSQKLVTAIRNPQSAIFPLSTFSFPVC